MAQDGRLRIGHQGRMFSRVSDRAAAGFLCLSRRALPGRREACRTRRPGGSANPAGTGRLSWPGQVAEESSLCALGPRSSPGPRWPVPRMWLACLRSSVIPLPVVLPRARRPGFSKLPVLTGTNLAGVHTLKSGMGRDANLIPHPPCVTGAPLATGDSCRVRQGLAPPSAMDRGIGPSGDDGVDGLFQRTGRVAARLDAAAVVLHVVGGPAEL